MLEMLTVIEQLLRYDPAKRDSYLLLELLGVDTVVDKG